MTSAAIPEIGNLVRLRGGMWVVSDVAPAAHLRNGDHLVKAVSIDGPDQVEVIWEVEPATQVIQKIELPDPTTAVADDPRTLDAFLDAVAWGAITSAEQRTLQSPFRAGIRIEDYQIVPLLRALQMARANLLVADDVGVGKTIECGLVLHEFVLRHRVRNCLVVAPASLLEKWRWEMADKFGLDFTILDSAEVRNLRRTRGKHINPLHSHPFLIASMDWLKRPEQEPMLDAALPPEANVYPRPFDMLIVDEAHHVAPTGDGKYATDSQRTRLVQRLVPYFEHRLFLTATPHNGKSESFQALLSLIDPQQFARGVRPTEAQLRRVMVRRLKSHIAEIRPDAPFAKRVLHQIEVSYSKEEHKAYGLLSDYATSRVLSAAGDAQQRQAADFVTLLLKKRFLSSPRAFASTLDQHIDTALKSSGTTERSPKRLRELYDAAQESHSSDDEVDTAEWDALAAAQQAGSGLTAEQAKMLEDLRGWASQHRNSPSAKADALVSWLNETCRDGDGGWNDERVVIFTEYRDTQNWLRDVLVDTELAGTDGERLELIHGGVDDDDRERIMGDFNYHPDVTPVRILLCTDAASEGVDLHLHCHRVVHFDIPFSPTKMEQRNGRVDRHGQRSETADVYYFTADPDSHGPAADTWFQDLIVRRLDEIREDLGDANDLLDERPGRLTSDNLARQHENLLTGRQTTIQDRPRRPAAEAEIQQIIRDARTAIDDARAALNSTRDELDLSPDEVAHTVNVALTLDHQPGLTETGTDGVWDVPATLSQDWQDTLLSLWDPRRELQRPVTFDAELAAEPPGPVYLHLAHPLVARATELLRAQMWTRTSTAEALSRITARPYEDHLLPDGHPARGSIAVVAHARVVITGGDGSRLHESVVKVGGRLAQQFARFGTLRETDEVWTARRDNPAELRGLADRWDDIASSLLKGVTDRGYEVAGQVDNRLDQRRDDEEQHFRAILAELKANIADRLRRLGSDENQTQLRLELDTDERQQWELDLHTLRVRLDELDDEIETEIEAVRRRYETRDPRVFPMTVTFLLPTSQKAT